MAGRGKWLWTLGLALLAPLAWAADYDHYQLGDPDAPTPGKVTPGLLLSHPRGPAAAEALPVTVSAHLHPPLRPSHV